MKWHYTENGDKPRPNVLCVVYNGEYQVCSFDDAWYDQEDGLDQICDFEDVYKWAYLDEGLEPNDQTYYCLQKAKAGNDSDWETISGGIALEEDALMYGANNHEKYPDFQFRVIKVTVSETEEVIWHS